MRWSRVAVLVLGLLVAGCSASAADSKDSFQLHEFAIEGPSSIAVGERALEITNAGEFPHTLVVTDSGGHVLAATDLIQPGATTALDIDLADGRYTFTCRIVAQNDQGEIIDHFQMGMNTTVDVSG